MNDCAKKGVNMGALRFFEAHFLAKMVTTDISYLARVMKLGKIIMINQRTNGPVNTHLIFGLSSL